MTRHVHRAAIVCLALLGSGARAEVPVIQNQQSPPRRPEPPVLKYDLYELPNGLTVILHQDHKTPVAAVNVWYRVGAKDEQPGRTGFAHLFEHMMFQGSKHHDQDYFVPLERLGADVNGSTAEDETVYYETVPSNALERALWLEADRMGFLLPAMTADRLENQRDVVKNERGQTVDNVPYGLAEERLLEALYPAGHPYHHSVIGSMADLSAATLGDVQAFFRAHYVPNHAILCVAGDFEPGQVRRWIEKYFGPIPRGRGFSPPRPRAAVLDAPRRIEMTDRVSMPLAQLVWPTVPTAHPDEAPLDVLAAILGGLAKENRLFRALQYERQLASSVSASNPTHLLAGRFEIDLYARPVAGEDPRKQLDDLIARTDVEILRLKREGPTEAEVIKAQNERESSIVMSLQSATQRARLLNLYYALEGDPLGYRSELVKIFAVTPADVKRVAEKYLGPGRVELKVLPGAQAVRAPETAARPAEPSAAPSSGGEIKDDFDRSIMPPLGPPPRFTPPRFVRGHLSNGLELRIVERRDLPIVTFDLVVKSGETSTPAGKEGLATLTAGMLEEGTSKYDSLAFAGALAEIGASFGASSDLESSSVGVTTLTRHLDRALDIYAQAILAPTFPAKELERLKLERLARLKARLDDPASIASSVFPGLLYGKTHPYGRPDLGTPASVAAITRDDVVGFHHKIMTTGDAVLVVVGDVAADAVARRLEDQLGGWKAAPTPEPVVIPPPAPVARGQVLYLIDKPGAAQSVIMVGRVGAARRSPDYHALEILNAILGGQFISRLNMNLREDKGYSYGVQSGFSFLKSPGPFEAGGAVKTAVTKESLIEIMNELVGVVGPKPIEDAELAFAREKMIQGFPSRFETTFGVAGQIALLVEDDLPDDEYEHFLAKVEAVTRGDIARVAKTYITPKTMTILIVGDRKTIEPPLAGLPFVKSIEHLDVHGNPIAAESRTP